MSLGTLRTVRTVRTFVALALVLACASYQAPAGAQSKPIRGFPDDAVAAERAREEQFRKVPEAARLKEYMEFMAADPHTAGQLESRKIAEYAPGKFKSWGLNA